MGHCNGDCRIRLDGEARLCCNDYCVPIESPECGQVIGSLQDERAILFGFVGVEASSSRIQSLLKLSLPVGMAYSEMVAAVDASAPPFAFVTCNMASDPLAAFAHLTELCVPAIYADDLTCGLVNEDECGHAMMAYASIAAETDVALVVRSTSPGVIMGGHSEQIWEVSPVRLIASMAPMAKFASQLQVSLRNRQPRAATVSVSSQLGWSSAATQLFEDELSANDWNVVANEADGRYEQFVWGRDRAVLGGLAQLQPDIVFVITEIDYGREWPAGGPNGFEPFPGAIIGSVEASLPAVTRPVYVVPARGGSLLDAVANDPGLASRIYVVEPTSQDPTAAIADAFRIRFAALIGEPAPVAASTVAAYDGAYLLGAIAASRADDVQLSPTLISDSLRRMNPPGTRFAVGPDDFGALVAQLHGGRDVDLEGASGPLTNPPDVQVWCVESGTEPSFRPAGLLYRDVTGEVFGHLVPCR
jgi:hypothetical protein